MLLFVLARCRAAGSLRGRDLQNVPNGPADPAARPFRVAVLCVTGSGQPDRARNVLAHGPSHYGRSHTPCLFPRPCHRSCTIAFVVVCSVTTGLSSRASHTYLKVQHYIPRRSSCDSNLQDGFVILPELHPGQAHFVHRSCQFPRVRTLQRTASDRGPLVFVLTDL